MLTESLESAYFEAIHAVRYSGKSRTLSNYHLLTRDRYDRHCVIFRRTSVYILSVIRLLFGNNPIQYLRALPINID